MKTFQRSIAMLLAVLMLTGLLPIGVFSQDLQTALIETLSAHNDVIESDPIPFPDVLKLGEPKNVYLNAEEVHTLQFTPDSDGYYAFYSEGGFDTCANLYKGDGFLDLSDDEGEENNFYMQQKLTAGVTYSLKVNFYNPEESGAFIVAVIKKATPTAMNFSVDNVKKVAVGADDYSLFVNFGPENAATEEITVTIANEDILSVDALYYEYYEKACAEVALFPKAVGTTTVTATTASGLSNTFEVTVLPAEAYTPGETKHITVPADTWGYTVLYNVPEDGFYRAECFNYPEETGWETTFVCTQTGNRVYSKGYNQFELQAGTYYCCVRLVRDPGMDTSLDFSVKKLVPATSVKIINSVLNGEVDDTLNIYFEYAPENAIYESFTLTSDNPAVAVPEEDADYLHLLSPGTANITITSETGLTDTVAITVNALPSAEHISLNHEGVDAYVGFPLDLEVFRFPEGSAYEEITWSVDDPTAAVIRVDENDSERAVYTFTKPGLYTVTATNESGLRAGCTVTVKSVCEFSDSTPLQLSFYNCQSEMAKFTVAETGWYRIYSDEILTNDLYLTVFNENFEEIFCSDGIPAADCYFEKGKTYYVEIQLYLDEKTDFTMKTKALVPATSFSLSTDSVTGNVLSFFDLEAIFAPENAARENVYFEIEDSEIAVTEYLGTFKTRIWFYKVGTTTLTATTASGMSATATVTVTEPDALTLDQKKTIRISPDQSCTLRFIPQSSGFYAFSFQSDEWTEVGVYDDHFNQICYFSGTDEKDQVPMTAGTVYYVSFTQNDAKEPHDCDVTVSVPPAPTTIEFDAGESIANYVDTELYLDYTFGPNGCYPESTTLTTDNPAVVSILSDSRIYLESAGTAKVTITSESGLTDTITVISHEIPTLPFNTQTAVNLVQATEYTRIAKIFFKPAEDGEYALHLTGSTETRYTVESDNFYDEIPYRTAVANFVLSKDQTYLITFQAYAPTSVLDLKMTKSVALEKLELTSYPERMDYIDGFDYFDYTGLTLTGTLVGGRRVTWKSEGDSDGYLGGYYIDINNAYDEHDEYKKTTVTCNGKTVEFSFRIHENRVDRLELVQGTAISCIENRNGYKQSGWYYYNITRPADAIVKVHYKDGSSKTVSLLDDVDYHYRLEWDSNQYDKHWTVGTNQSTIYYLDKEINLPITVHPSPVESIEYLGDTFEITEHSNGYYDSEGTYFYYTGFANAAKIQINYKDGTTKTLSLIDDNKYTSEFDFDTYQQKDPWLSGNTYYIHVDYYGASCKIPVTIIENHVDRLELLSAPTAVYYYGDINYGWTNKEGYHLSSPYNLEGLSFRIHYDNGTHKDVFHTDLTDDNYYNGMELEVSPVDMGTQIVGSVPITLTFMGKTLSYSVSLVESPVASLEVVELPAGLKEDDFCYPNFMGTKIKINYKNGTHKTVTFTEENTTVSSGETPSLYLDTDDICMEIAFDYAKDSWAAELYGVSVKLDVPHSGKKDVKKLELLEFKLGFKGSRLLVTYEDGSTEEITLGKAHENYSTNDFLYGFVEIPGGFAYFDWEIYTDARSYAVLTIYSSEMIIPLSQIAGQLLGDLDENGAVDEDDAIYLLYHVYFPEAFPITRDADYDKNGRVDLEDAFYLLYHVSFPHSYPLN